MREKGWCKMFAFKTLRRESVNLKLNQKRMEIETDKLGCLRSCDITEMTKFIGKAPLPSATQNALQNADLAYSPSKIEVLIFFGDYARATPRNGGRHGSLPVVLTVP